jgi:hypothetical protein
MSLPRPLLPLLAVAAALPAAPARAAFFNGEPVDGPDPGIRAVGDVDVARDGTGAVAYVKRDGGVDHVFVSRLVNGVWQTPERVDAGLAGAGSQPVVAASDGGRVAVAYISGGQLFAAVRPAGAPGFTAPQGLAGAASNPSIDMSINGGAYISFTTSADVRVAWMDRKAQAFALLPAVLDINPGAAAGDGLGRSRIAVSADGTAVALWGENGHVYGRRIFFDRVSTAPQDLNVASLEGHTGRAADSPAIDIEDDSSFAWATFRQQFDDNRYHLVAKRLVGSLFEQETKVDGVPWGSADQVAEGVVEISGRGEGLAMTSTAGFGAQAALVHDNTFFPAVGLGQAGTTIAHTAGGIAENNDGYAFFLQGATPLTAAVHAVSYDLDPAKRTVPPPGPDTVVSEAAVDANAGFDAAVNRAGDAVALYVQDGAGGRRLMSAGFDRVPGTFRTYTSSGYRKASRPALSWSPAFELWGPPAYTVLVDGKPYGTTTATRLDQTTAPIPDGVHQWRVSAADRRGQTVQTPVRTLRIDATPPAATFTISGSRKRGKPVRVRVKAADGSLKAPSGSGVKVVRVAFGDGATAVGRDVTHRYRRGGSFTVRVTVGDKAGNVLVLRRKVRIGKG